MRYQTTEQYRRGDEHFIAEFDEYHDWLYFKEARLKEDEVQKRAVLYRLYEHSELVEVVNPAELSIAIAQYADGGRVIEVSPPLIYCLILKTLEAEREVARFDYYSDAKLFLMVRCVKDKVLRDHDFFCLLKYHVLMETFSMYAIGSVNDSAASHAVTARFHPTPTPTTFKPSGFPPDHWREDEDKQ